MSSNCLLRILSVSDDEVLGFSREMVLRCEGYEVESVSSREYLAAPRSRHYDLAIVCQSVDPRHAGLIVAMLRRHLSLVRVMRLNSVASGQESGYDLMFDALSGPSCLLEAVQQVASRPRGAIGGYSTSEHHPATDARQN